MAAKSATKKMEPIAKLILPEESDLNAFGGKKSKLELLADARDQRAKMFELVGDLSGVQVMGNRVLVGIYIEPGKRGSIILDKKTLAESIYQGTVGLVLKLGDQAFKDDPDNKISFHGQIAGQGDYVAFKAGDAKRCQLNGIDCRLIEDTLIDLKVANPNIVTHEKI